MSERSYSVAFPRPIHDEAIEHLLRDDGQEDLCFGLWYPSEGRSRTSSLVARLILPGPEERRVHGNASFLSAYFERALGEAIVANAGLAFMHSHLGPGWQDMSADDIQAERGCAGAVKGATGLPLVGLTLGTDGAWSGRFWKKVRPRTYERRWCSSVRVIGEALDVTYMDRLFPPPRSREVLRRTVSAWGEDIQAKLARLHVGVVGAGSVGSIVAEALARIGIARVTLIDFDTIESVNLDRSLHATNRDVVMGRSKVSCLARSMRRSATAEAFVVHEVDRSIVEPEGYTAALDCDVLFSCVDRPWARSVLNFIAYAHLIPVVDGGVRLEPSPRGGLRRADMRAHIAGVGHRCLECMGQYDPGLVPVEREGFLDDPKYIESLPADDPLRRNENVFAFSLLAASSEILQLLMAVVAPMGIGNAGEQMYHFVPGLWDEPGFGRCQPTCPYSGLIANGDRTGLVVTSPHLRAEKTRDRRNHHRIPLGYRLADRLLEKLDAYVARSGQQFS